MQRSRRPVATAMVALATVVASEAGAQPQPPPGQPQAPPGQPPPGFQPAPGQPPPGAPQYPYPYPYPVPYPPGAPPYPYPYGFPPPYPVAPPPAPPRPQPEKELDYSPGEPIPEDYRLVTRENKALVTSGALLFGIPYLGGAAATGLVMLTIGLVDALGGGGSDVEPFIPMFVPVAGPFITLYTARHDLEGGTRALVVADGVVQTVGMGLLVAGLVWPEQILVYRGHSPPTLEPVAPPPFVPGAPTAPPPPAAPPPAPATLRVLPSVGPTGFGLALAGTL